MFADFGQIRSEQMKGLIKGLQFLTTTEKAFYLGYKKVTYDKQ